MPRGKITVLFGSSGAGKLTMLRLIAVPEIADIGRILRADQLFKAMIDREESDGLGLQVGDDVVVGAKSSDVILFKILT